MNTTSTPATHPNYRTVGNNAAVLQAAWPYFFKPGYVSTGRPLSELFGESFAASLTNGVNYANRSANYDAYFNTINNWSGLFCTKNFVKWVATNGTLPASGTGKNYYAVNGVANPNNCPFS